MAKKKWVVVDARRGDVPDWVTRVLTLGILGLEDQTIAQEGSTLNPEVAAFTTGRAVQRVIDWRRRPYVFAWGLGNRSKR